MNNATSLSSYSIGWEKIIKWTVCTHSVGRKTNKQTNKQKQHTLRSVQSVSDQRMPVTRNCVSSACVERLLITLYSMCCYFWMHSLCVQTVHLIISPRVDVTHLYYSLIPQHTLNSPVCENTHKKKNIFITRLWSYRYSTRLMKFFSEVTWSPFVTSPL